AAIADGESELRGFGHAADTDSALEAVRKLGVEVSEPDLETVRIRGRGLRGLVAPDEPLDCGNAGTVLRLLSGILAGQDGRSFELIGDESLSSRPVRVDEPLGQMGARVETNDGRPPVTIEGANLRPIAYELPVASAQLKSRSEEHTSELQSLRQLVCRLLHEKKNCRPGRTTFSALDP